MPLSAFRVCGVGSMLWACLALAPLRLRWPRLLRRSPFGRLICAWPWSFVPQVPLERVFVPVGSWLRFSGVGVGSPVNIYHGSARLFGGAACFKGALLLPFSFLVVPCFCSANCADARVLRVAANAAISGSSHDGSASSRCQVCGLGVGRDGLLVIAACPSARVGGSGQGAARSHAQPLGEHGEHGALAPFPFTAMGATAPHYLPRVCAADRLQIL